MNSRYRSIHLVGLALAVVLLSAADTHQALRTGSAGIFLIREGEVVDESLYVAGSVVRISGTIEGDLVVLATDRLEVSGRVEGDIMGFATTADITGMIAGSVRLAGVDLEIAAEVGEDAVGLGRDVRLGGSIASDSLVWSSSLFAGGEVGRDLVGRTSGTTTIAGTVGRDVEMTVGRMRVVDSARVGEDLGYRSARPATIEPGATIGGVAVHRLPLAPDPRVRAGWLMMGFVAFMLYPAAGLLIIRTCSDRLVRSVARLTDHPFRCSLRGLIRVAALALPAAVVYGGVVWGSPRVAVGLALAGLVMFPLVLFLLVWLTLTALVPVLVALGRLASRGRLSDHGAFLLSAVPMALVLLIPYVGMVIAPAVLVLGAGAWARGGPALTDRCRKHRWSTLLRRDDILR